MEAHPADWLIHAGWLGNTVLAAVSRESAAIQDTAGARAAVDIALSAILYLFDFGTNLSTLHQYYIYAFNCHNHMHDPICSIVTISGSGRFQMVFGVGVFLITVAHLSNSLIFWMTLSPNEHPLRLAYFLPFIHLSRLLKVLWRSTSSSCNSSLKDLHDSQEQSSTLYNVLGASLETIPLLILQFRVTITLLGEYGLPSSDTSTQPNIPKIMTISLLASMVFATYSGSVALLSLVPKHMSLVRKACIAIVVGFYTLAAMSAKAVIIAALADSVEFFLAKLIMWSFTMPM